MVRALLVGLIAVALLGELSVMTGPSVVGAPDAVTAIDRAHGTTPRQVSPTDRIAVALVSAEDASFYSNDGIDLPSLFRAGWGYIRGFDGGGSTIEVQLADVLYPTETSGPWGRVHRVTLALQFDTHFTKGAILSMYLSAVYFGHGYYGVAAASHGYFGAPPDALGWAQAALLAGLVQAPSALDPFVHLAAARQRMEYVVGRLVADNRISAAQAVQISNAPLDLRA